MTSPPIGTDEELIERAHGIAFGLEQDCRTDAADVIVELSDALQSRISEVERLREALRSLVGAVERRWPDSDFTTSEHFAEPMNQARAALSQHRTTG